MEVYRGVLLHSSEYRNATSFLGKRVLVVGFGNSGGEIALDLVEASVDVALAVRGPVQILPRDLLVRSGGDDFGAHPRQHLLHLEPRRADVARQRRRERTVGAFAVERHAAGCCVS